MFEETNLGIPALVFPLSKIPLIVHCTVSAGRNYPRGRPKFLVTGTEISQRTGRSKTGANV